MSPSRRRAAPSPAALALAAEGARCADLAESLNVSPVAVMRWLAGTRGMPPSLPGALVDLVGPDVAERILAAIPERTEAAAA